MNKRWSSLLLAIVMTFSISSFAFADSLQEQLKESKENINEIKSDISEVKSERNDVLSELKKIEAQVDKVEDEIDSLKRQVNTTKKSVKDTEKELGKAIEEYNLQRELYQNRVKTMYMNGPSGYLEIVLSSDGFSDFLTRMDVVRKIIEYDTNVLKEMLDRQEKINKRKTELEVQQRKLITLEKDLGVKKTTLDSANADKKKVYNKLNSDLAALEKALDEEIEESNAIAEQIKKLTSGSSGGSYSGSKTGILKVSDIGRIPKVTSPFGMRWHPVLKKYKMHTGIDIGIPSGTPIYSLSEGTVILSKYSESYGHYIIVNHGGISSLYAHLSSRLVSVGQTVKKGQLIAKSGNTGRSTGPHLHYEIRNNSTGAAIDPMPYYVVGE